MASIAYIIAAQGVAVDDDVSCRVIATIEIGVTALNAFIIDADMNTSTCVVIPNALNESRVNWRA